MQKLFNSRYGWFYLLIGIIILNILASNVNARYDMTSEKRYTLTQPVKNMLGRVNEQVSIDILLEGNLKSGLRKLRNSTEAMLQEFNEYAHGNIHYRLIDPVAGGDDTSSGHHPGFTGKNGHSADDPDCTVQKRRGTKSAHCDSRCHRKIQRP